MSATWIIHPADAQSNAWSLVLPPKVPVRSGLLGRTLSSLPCIPELQESIHVSDQTPPDETSPTANEQRSVDVSARLASLSVPRAGVTSIWQRREATAPPPAPSVETSDDIGHSEATSPASISAPTPAAVTRPTPASATGASIGRLTRVSAAELWIDANAMATWVAGNAEALSELTGVEGLRLHAPNAGTVLGAAADGGAVCVVCEVGPSSDGGLGALLRTAAVQDGGTVVWLNGGAGDAHVAALSWLNRATPPRFFLAKATGVRIGESASAPMFELLVRPPRAAEPANDTSDAPQRRVEDHVPED